MKARTVVLAGAMVVWGAAPASPQENSPFGVVSAPGLANDVCRQNDLVTLGTGWVRAAWTWESVEVAQDRFEWEQPDRLVDEMEARGISIFWDFSYTPCWASGRPCHDGPFGPGTATWHPDETYTPLSQADLRQYVMTVVARYRGRHIIWGGWNEADDVQFYKGPGTGQPNITQYKTRELQTIVTAIREADPAATIVVGELSSRAQSNPGLLVQVLEAVKGKFDAISLHIYSAGDNCAGRTTALDTLRNYLLPYGYLHFPVWVTETGGLTSVSANATYLTCFWNAMQQRPWWKKSFWYNYEPPADRPQTGLLGGGT